MGMTCSMSGEHEAPGQWDKQEGFPQTYTSTNKHYLLKIPQCHQRVALWFEREMFPQGPLCEHLVLGGAVQRSNWDLHPH